MATVIRAHDPEPESRAPVVLFGQRGKLREEGPFFSLLAESEMALADTTRLIVIGYSFRDPHIITIIRRWTRGDESRTVVVIDPSFPTDHQGWRTSGDFRMELLAHLNQHTLTVDEPDFDNRLEIWTITASEALAKMVSL